MGKKSRVMSEPGMGKGLGMGSRFKLADMGLMKGLKSVVLSALVAPSTAGTRSGRWANSNIVLKNGMR